jgi:aryl-phospho-beta-D-glucosidase BglC (GH1 family)
MKKIDQFERDFKSWIGSGRQYQENMAKAGLTLIRALRIAYEALEVEQSFNALNEIDSIFSENNVLDQMVQENQDMGLYDNNLVMKIEKKVIEED